jgi:hypothetical protein
MTCREFKQNAEALTLWELTRAGDERLLSHTQQCESCGVWLREQRALAGSLHTLQARTAAMQASPDVEQAVLQAFRQKKAQGAVAAPSMSASALTKGEEQEANGDILAPPIPIIAASPFALRASRWFEVGAYAAVAAAIVVGLFLGVRLLQHNSKPAPAQSQNSSSVSKPESPKQATATEPQSAAMTPASTSKRHVVSAHKQPRADQQTIAEASLPAQPNTAQESQADNAGYVPLMFCDPLSCAADSQVVRMELPPNPASQGLRPQVADVVVGYDGVVRAVRMVN